jgi:hypothetical protein
MWAWLRDPTVPPPPDGAMQSEVRPWFGEDLIVA